MDVGLGHSGAASRGNTAIDIDAIFDALSEEDQPIVASVMRGVGVAAIYLLARVNKLGAKMGLLPGHSLDLTNGWVSRKLRTVSRLGDYRSQRIRRWLLDRRHARLSACSKR